MRPFHSAHVPPGRPPEPSPPRPPNRRDQPPIEDEPDPVRDPETDIPPLDQPEPNPDEEKPPMTTSGDGMPVSVCPPQPLSR